MNHVHLTGVEFPIKSISGHYSEILEEISREFLLPYNSRYVSSGFSGSTKLGNLGHVFYHVVFKSHVITSAFDRTPFTHYHSLLFQRSIS
jgi:hypothetical protein